MRKFLLSLATLFVASSAAFAQVDAAKVKGLSVEKNLNAVVAPLKSAPLKADLKENQRIVGLYTSDNLAENGVGIPNYGAFSGAKAAIELTSDILSPYVGKKIVGIRFGLCAAVGTSRVFIAPLSSEGSILSDVVSQDVASTVKGWNTVTLETPYTIEADKSYFVGFDYNQKATRSGQYYTDECYPLSIVNEGLANQYLYIYANISSAYQGSGEGWYNFGNSNGNLSIQVIVEGEFSDYDVTPSDFKKAIVGLDTEKTISVEFFNNSKEAVSSLDYILTVDGVASAEQYVDLASAVAISNSGSFDVTVPAQATKGTKAITVEVTKVNGHENLASDKVASGSIAVVDKVYNRNCVVEEFTTEQCPQCPTGAKILHNTLAKVDETRVFAACHHSAYYTDWLTKNWDSQITSLMYGGTGSTFAPGVMLNRNSEIVPSNGSNMGNVFSINAYSATTMAAFINSQLAETSNAALNIEATPNEDGTVLNVKVTGECNEGFDQEAALLTLYLTQDSLKAKSQSGATGVYYHMHVIRYANSPWGEAVTWNNNAFEANFSITLSTAWVKKDLKLIAFLNKHNESDYTDNAIENSIGCDYPYDATGINGVVNDGNAVEVARYTIDGQLLSAPQKGLNIVKMSNGQTMKVMVK